MKKIAELKRDMVSLYPKIKNKELTKVKIAELYGTTHTTVANIMKDFERKQVSLKVDESKQKKYPKQKRTRMNFEEKKKLIIYKELVKYHALYTMAEIYRNHFKNKNIWISSQLVL